MPCALCLLERWPYRVAIVLALVAAVVPHRLAGCCSCWSCWRCWSTRRSPSCMSGSSCITGRARCRNAPHRASPAARSPSAWRRCRRGRPSPARTPAYLIPGLPISMAAMNLLYALAFAIVLAILLWRDQARCMSERQRACPAIRRRAAVARMIRVDHAGEYGAARIYAGQLAVLRRGETAPVLREMQAQEQPASGPVRRSDRAPPRPPDRDAAAVAPGRLRPRRGDRGPGRARGDGLHRGGRGSDRCALCRSDRGAGRQRGRSAQHPEHSSATTSGSTATSRCDTARSRRPGYRLLSAAIKAGCRIAIRISERI